MSCPLPQNACISPKAGERSVGPAGAAGLTWAGPWWAAAKVSAMGRAGAVCERGRETVVAVLVGPWARNALLARRVSELGERVAGQDERVAELERQLKRSCRNSSTPPSRDPPRAPERGRAPVCGRGRGARPGDRGRGRGLLAAAVDLVVGHWPERCGCGQRFSAREAVGRPARHRLAELPEIAVRVTEHRLRRRRCPACGAATRAALPAGVCGGAFGARLEAAVARCRSATASRAATRSSSPMSRSECGSRAGRSTPSWGAPPRRLRSPPRTRSTRCAAGGRHRRHPAGG
jgi:Family of unknown function (DUF6444)